MCYRCVNTKCEAFLFSDRRFLVADDGQPGGDRKNLFGVRVRGRGKEQERAKTL